MLIRLGSSLILAGSLACSGAEAPAAAERSEPEAAVAPALPSDPASYAVFVDPVTGFTTDEVHDADREIVHFEPALGVMVSAATGSTVSGWEANGTDLGWSRSGIPFRVRFGTELGERRAYFTEAGPGTICNLRIAGTDQLFISGTNETPPNP
jgi:hypothetical protein